MFGASKPWIFKRTDYRWETFRSWHSNRCCSYHSISTVLELNQQWLTLVSQISCAKLVICKYYTALGSSLSFHSHRRGVRINTCFVSQMQTWAKCPTEGWVLSRSCLLFHVGASLEDPQTPRSTATIFLADMQVVSGWMQSSGESLAMAWHKKEWGVFPHSQEQKFGASRYIEAACSWRGHARAMLWSSDVIVTTQADLQHTAIAQIANKSSKLSMPSEAA